MESQFYNVSDAVSEELDKIDPRMGKESAVARLQETITSNLIKRAVDASKLTLGYPKVTISHRRKGTRMAPEVVVEIHAAPAITWLFTKVVSP